MNEGNAKWHQMSIDAVCRKLHTDAAAGLSRRAARSRYKKEGANTLFDIGRNDLRQLFRPLLRDPGVWILIGGTLLALLFGALETTLLLLLFAGICVAVSLSLILRYRDLLRTSRDARVPRVTVLREGTLYRVSARAVVRGDVLLLRRGDVVPCDCRILSMREAEVLTLLPDDGGRAKYARLPKNAEIVYPYASPVFPPQYENMLFGGSEVVAGELKAVVVERSERTYVGAMQSMRIPAEARGDADALSVPKALDAYLRVYGFAMLILFGTFSLLGIFLTPDSRNITDTFFSLCVLLGCASPAVVALLVRFIKIKGMTDLHRQDDAAVLKSARAADAFNRLTDLVIIGHGASSDGVLHFDGAMVKDARFLSCDDEELQLLQPLCEALCILRASRAMLPTADREEADALDCATDELIRLSAFDHSALEIRLKGLQKTCADDSTVELSVRLSGREDHLVFSENARILTRCVLYEDGGTPRAISRELRQRMLAFVSDAERDALKTVTVLRRYRDGTLSFVGILTMREHRLSCLGSIAEQMETDGIRTRFVLTGADDSELAYAKACQMPGPYLVRDEKHPKLTQELLEQYRVLIGFPISEFSSVLKDWKRQGRHAAVFTGDPNARRCLPSATLISPCPDRLLTAEIEPMPNNEPTSLDVRCAEGVKRRAELLVAPADRDRGGLLAVRGVLVRMRAVVRHTELLLRFLIVSQLSRLALCVTSLIFGMGTPDAASVFLVGGLSELLVCLFICHLPISNRLLSKSVYLDERRVTSLLLRRDTLISVAASVALTSLYGAILFWTGVWSATLTNAYFAASAIALQIVTLYVVTWKQHETIRSRQKLLPALIALGMSMLPILLAALRETQGDMADQWILYMVAILSLPLLPSLCAVIKFILSFFHRTAK